MPKVSPLQSDFSGGEIGASVQGRIDLDRYKVSLKRCSNYIPTNQGSLTRRPGFEFIEEVKDSSKSVRLMPFKFSASDAVIIEVGHLYMRFYKDYGQLQLDAAPYEITTPWAEDEIFDINVNQSADVLYLTHPGHVPYKLSRFGGVAWVLSKIDLPAGPWESYPDLSLASIVNSSGLTGTVTLTATLNSLGPVSTISNNGGRFQVEFTNPATPPNFERIKITGATGTVAANGDWDVEFAGGGKFILLGSTYAGTYSGGASAAIPFFHPNDVGRYIRLQELGQTTVGIAKITGVTSGAVATATVTTDLTTLVGGVGYRAKFGLYTLGKGPRASCFFEDRLFFIGNPGSPQRIDGSRTGQYEDFGTTEASGVPTAASAVSFVLNSNDVNNGKWLFSDGKGLLSGTLSGEWIVKSASSQEALSPTSISAKQECNAGSSDCYPVQIGKSVIFAKPSGRKIQELSYFYDVDGFRTNDLSILNEEITASGIKQMAVTKEPQQIVWMARNDGSLIGLTYDRDSESLKAGWHRHEIGGDGLVESVAAIPSSDGTQTDLWVVINRTINGVTKRYIEVMNDYFDDESEQMDAFYLDSGLTYDVPLTITDIDETAGVLTVTSAGHGLSNGNEVLFTDIKGTTELNYKIYAIENVTTDTFDIDGLDGSGFAAYISGGIARKQIQTITGLSHLEGESVHVLANGGAQGPFTVASGSITLASKAAVVHIGLNYYSEAQMNRINAGAADGTALGKTRRTNKFGILFARSLNLKYGENFDSLNQLTFTGSNQDYISEIPAISSGIEVENLNANYDFENELCWRQDLPLPSTILAIMPQMTTQDR